MLKFIKIKFLYAYHINNWSDKKIPRDSHVSRIIFLCSFYVFSFERNEKTTEFKDIFLFFSILFENI